jgi:uncharacterized protein
MLQFSMALLIDGYNLLNVTGIFGEDGPGTALHRTRMAFLNFLAESFTKRERNATTIVFDAAAAPPGLPSTLAHDGMTIHFARRQSDADEMIEELLEDWKAPKSLLVVSSDHRVQRAARHCGARFVDSEVWYSELLTTKRRRAVTENATTKPAGKPTADELAYWLKEFGEMPAANSEAESPFPPGYAKDVEADEN